MPVEFRIANWLMLQLGRGLRWLLIAPFSIVAGVVGARKHRRLVERRARRVRPQR